MMVICIKQHLSNIWSSIYEKVKQHWGRVEKSVAYKKKACIYMKQTKRNSKIQTTMFFYPRGKFTLKSVPHEFLFPSSIYLLTSKSTRNVFRILRNI